MKKQSAGILVYRRSGLKVEVLLGHSGGPMWVHKRKSAWSIPKGHVEEGEDVFTTAQREFEEEIGHPAPEGDFIDLGTSEASNKTLLAWAVEGDMNVATIKSNTFSMEWPPRSGEVQEFPEIDQAAWFDITKIGDKLPKAQHIFLARLAEKLGLSFSNDSGQQTSLL